MFQRVFVLKKSFDEEHLTQYKYQGLSIHKNGKDNEDVINKIGKGKAIIMKVHSLRCGGQI